MAALIASTSPPGANSAIFLLIFEVAHLLIILSRVFYPHHDLFTTPYNTFQTQWPQQCLILPALPVALLSPPLSLAMRGEWASLYQTTIRSTTYYKGNRHQRQALVGFTGQFAKRYGSSISVIRWRGIEQELRCDDVGASTQNDPQDLLRSRK